MTDNSDDKIEIENPHTEDGSQNTSGIAAPPTVAGDEPPPREVDADGANPEDQRAAIAARFKRVRVDKEPPVETTGDFLDPSQVYGQVAAQNNAPAPTQEAAPKRKVKVNGEEREITDEEYHAAAQKALAAEKILEQAKERLAESKRVLETTRVHVSRQNPAEEPAPFAAEGDNDDGQQNPADPLADVVQEIQYGDPDRAKEKLGKTIAEAAAAAVKTASYEERFTTDLKSDLLAHDEFVKKHAQYANDEVAVSVIRDGLAKGYAEDLRRIGVPEERIPYDVHQLANHHRQYKLQGQPVRSVSTLLDAAAERLMQWRGGPPARSETTAPPSTDPRVEVNLHRDDRRRAIPQQPPRANVQPPQTSQTPATQQTSRHSAVQRAQAARGQ